MRIMVQFRRQEASGRKETWGITALSVKEGTPRHPPLTHTNTCSKLLRKEQLQIQSHQPGRQDPGGREIRAAHQDAMITQPTEGGEVEVVQGDAQVQAAHPEAHRVAPRKAHRAHQTQAETHFRGDPHLEAQEVRGDPTTRRQGRGVKPGTNETEGGDMKTTCLSTRTAQSLDTFLRNMNGEIGKPHSAFHWWKCYPISQMQSFNG